MVWLYKFRCIWTHDTYTFEGLYSKVLKNCLMFISEYLYHWLLLLKMWLLQMLNITFWNGDSQLFEYLLDKHQIVCDSSNGRLNILSTNFIFFFFHIKCFVFVWFVFSGLGGSPINQCETEILSVLHFHFLI